MARRASVLAIIVPLILLSADGAWAKRSGPFTLPSPWSWAPLGLGATPTASPDDAATAQTQRGAGPKHTPENTAPPASKATSKQASTSAPPPYDPEDDGAPTDDAPRPPTGRAAAAAPSPPRGACAAGVAVGMACARPGAARAAGAAAAAPAAPPHASRRGYVTTAVWAPVPAGSPPRPYVSQSKLSPDCKASAVRDLDSRVMSLGYRAPYTGTTPQGPFPITFPAVAPGDAPAGCDAEAWARARLLGAIEGLVALGFCYCHHHAVLWQEPPGAGQGSCNPACKGTRARPHQGMDCSNYSAYLYNLAFGLRFTSGIGKQACQPGGAPGRLLPYTAADTDKFRPGDLMYKIPSDSTGSASSASTLISHAYMWTGLTADVTRNGSALSLDTLIANVSPAKREGARAEVNKRLAAGLPVYVITDSTWTGPNYRPFVGGYVDAFSHARRVIGADESLPAGGDASGAVAFGGGNDCIARVCCAA